MTSSRLISTWTGALHAGSALLLLLATRAAALNRARAVFQLNVQNALQDEDYRVVRADPDGQLFRGITIAPERVAFSARFDF